MNYKNILLVFTISIFVGAVASGFLTVPRFSTISESTTKAIIPLDGQTYKFIGRTITSDPTKLRFYVNGKEITNGKVVDGIWLARQSTTEGLFYTVGYEAAIMSSVNPSLSPPTSVSIEGKLTDTSSLLFHAKGRWDVKDYNSLQVAVYRTDDNYLAYKANTVARLRVGEYNTMVKNAPGNIDAITKQDTVYRQFGTSYLPAGTYKVVFWEYYRGGVTSPEKSKTFTIVSTSESDLTPPVINRFEIKPDKFSKDDDIGITIIAEFKDRESGIEKAYVRWFTSTGPYKIYVDDGIPEVVTPKYFECGTTEVKLYVVNRQKRTSIKKLYVTKDCTPQQTPPPTEPPETPVPTEPPTEPPNEPEPTELPSIGSPIFNEPPPGTNYTGKQPSLLIFAIVSFATMSAGTLGLMWRNR